MPAPAAAMPMATERRLSKYNDTIAMAGRKQKPHPVPKEFE